jgi:regulatory protein YycH of two-component signal transduction system YycFG
MLSLMSNNVQCNVRRLCTEEKEEVSHQFKPNKLIVLENETHVTFKMQFGVNILAIVKQL